MSPRSHGGGYLAKRQEGLSPERLKELARASAEAMLERLRAEVIAIERTFPEFRQSQRAVVRSVRSTKKRARKMSAEARKEVSRRMKRYWAERRRAKAKADAAAE